MKNNSKTPAAPVRDLPPFKGYSMEELRYQRAMMALKKEFSRQKMAACFDSLRHPGGKSSDSGAMAKFHKAAAITSKLFANVKVLDIALVGLSVLGSGRKIYKLIGKKK